MTSATKALVAAIVAILVISSATWLGWRTVCGQDVRLTDLEQQAPALRAEIRQMRAQRAADLRALQPAHGADGARLPDSAISSEVQSLVGRIRALQERLARSPNQQIPELRLLTDRDWIEIARRNNHLETDEDFRRALGELRTRAVTEMWRPMTTALQGYLKASQSQLPADLTQLAPYFNPPMNADLLDRYEMRSTGAVTDNVSVSYKTALVGEKLSALPDPIYDDVVMFTTNGLVTSHAYDVDATVAAYKAFSDANNGQPPKNAEEALQDPNAGARFVEIAKARHVFGEP